MRKVTTINLNNNAYQIDEGGYEILRRYLEDAERALASNPDRAEIMADLEQAIADKCRLVLGQYKTVVSAPEIERILKEMGPVVANTGEASPDSTRGGNGTGGSAGTPSSPSPRPRLYRILEGRQLGGVCNGLAAYAGVDVTWVRVAFIAMAFFSGFGLIAYLVLYFVMPVADTPEELSAAHGHAFNAQELVDRVKQKHEDFRTQRRARRQARRDARRHGHWFTAHTAAPVGVPPRAPGPAARVAGNLMLPVFTVLSAGWFVVAAVTALMVWHAYQHTGFDWPHGHWNPAELPRWIPLVAVAVVYVLLALPIGAGRRAAVYYANGGRHHGWAGAWSGLLWIALVVILLAGAWTLLPHLRELLHDLLGWPTQTWTASWI